jgi:hypothetical protein
MFYHEFCGIQLGLHAEFPLNESITATPNQTVPMADPSSIATLPRSSLGATRFAGYARLFTRLSVVRTFGSDRGVD